MKRNKQKICYLLEMESKSVFLNYKCRETTYIRLMSQKTQNMWFK